MPQISAGRLGQVDRFLNGEIGALTVGNVVAIDHVTPGTVIRAQASSAIRMPAIGFVASLRGNVVAVQPSGAISVSPAILDGEDTVVVGAIYWVHPSIPGILTRTEPDAASLPEGGTAQPVAIGKALPRVLHIFVERRGEGVPAEDKKVRFVTEDDSVLPDDRVLILDAAAAPLTLSLPDAAERPGRELTIIRGGSGNNFPTASALPGQFIGGDLTWTPYLRGEAIDLIADGVSCWQAH